MEKEKIYYSTITFKSHLKKDNWKFGGTASTFFSKFKDGEPLKIEANVYGKTKQEAEEKMMKFLKGEGKLEIECIGKFLNEAEELSIQRLFQKKIPIEDIAERIGISIEQTKDVILKKGCL